MRPLFHGLLICLAVSCGLLAQGPAAERSESIRGQVVNTADGVPLRRARVEVTGGRRVDPVFTDDEGRFRVEGAPATSLTVKVTKAGYAPGLVTVPAGGGSTELSFALTKSAAVMGRVLNRYGGPIRFVTVAGRMILPAADKTQAAVRQFSVQTDELGEYRLGGLPPGRYEIMAGRRLPPGVAPSTPVTDLPRPVEDLLFGSRESLEIAKGALTIALTAGEEVQDVDFTIAGASATCPAASGRMPPVGTASIAGRVTGASGEPLACAIVWPVGPDAPDSSVSTDAQGRYVIEGLHAGSFVLQARKDYRLTLQYGQRHPSDAATPIVLRDKEQRTRVDFVLPHGSIVSGTVVDEHGEPVERTMVTAHRLLRSEGRTAAFTHAPPSSTDDRGQYRLIGLDPGTYIVAATGRGALSGTSPERAQGYVSHYYPGSPDPLYAQRVVLDAGRNADGIDIAFTPTRTFTVSGSVSGPVFEAIGRPFDGNVTLSVSGRSGAVSVDSRGGQVDADGGFVVRNVLPGDYVVKAVASPRGARLFGMQYVTVTDADPPPAAVTVVEGATVEGSWIIEGVQDQDTRRIEISAYTADPDFWPGLPGRPEAQNPVQNDRSSTIPAGMFRIDGVSGPSRFQVRTPWCEACYVKSMYVNGADVTNTPFDFGVRGGVYRDVEVILSDASATIEGRATDEREAPVATSYVVVFSTDRGLWYPASPHVRYERTTTGGAFRVTGLAPGEYFVAAVNRLDDAFPLGLETADPEGLAEQLAQRAERVTLSERDRRTMTLRLIRR
ncbi:MAG TPA: carboxypeptidase-like regulatory domain-containing protein [Vicinamibacterales bacterium]|nr:carboxypeptidase-like regulatory domain-containing protein [Vicinamibacterales bacterium]